MNFSIALVHTHNFTARLIQAGMWLWAVVRAKKPYKTWNHFEVRYDNLTSGAVGEGVITRPWEDYVQSKKFIEYIVYALPLTPEEQNKGLAYLQSVEGHKYEYAMFLWHFIKIICGHWHGAETQKKMFCYEHGIRFMNATGKYDLDPYLNPYEFKMWADAHLERIAI